MRSGYKTSEWWLALAAMIIGILISSGLIGDTSPIGKALAFIASALASVGYSYSRGMAKASQPPAAPPQTEPPSPPVPPA